MLRVLPTGRSLPVPTTDDRRPTTDDQLHGGRPSSVVGRPEREANFPNAILAVSLMSEATRPAHRAIVARLGERVGLGLEMVEGRPWQEQQQQLDTGEAQLAFICGLPYTVRAAWLQPLAAPVHAGARYGDQSIYFSDVVVRRTSPYQHFDDLRRARWAYNEPGSLSGHEVARAHLAAMGAARGFFDQAIESGAHLESLRLIVTGQADAAAVDSTVLELALRDEPALAEQVRVVATLGPNPAPPCVAARALPPALRERLRAALISLHEDQAGRTALALGGLHRFVPVEDADYDPVRRTARLAQGVSYT